MHRSEDTVDTDQLNKDCHGAPVLNPKLLSLQNISTTNTNSQIFLRLLIDDSELTKFDKDQETGGFKI